MKDPISVSRLQQLHPKVQDTFRQFIDECEATFNITLRITQGYRTIAEQNALYDHGRVAPGKVVTNAKGGQSFHNFGLAVDLAELVNSNTEINWSYDMSTLKPVADKYGITWGGSWVHIVDKPHFEINFGYPENCEELLALVNAGKIDENGYVNLA